MASGGGAVSGVPGRVAGGRGGAGADGRLPAVRDLVRRRRGGGADRPRPGGPPPTRRPAAGPRRPAPRPLRLPPPGPTTTPDKRGRRPAATPEPGPPADRSTTRTPGAQGGLPASVLIGLLALPSRSSPDPVAIAPPCSAGAAGMSIAVPSRWPSPPPCCAWPSSPPSTGRRGPAFRACSCSSPCRTSPRAGLYFVRKDLVNRLRKSSAGNTTGRSSTPRRAEGYPGRRCPGDPAVPAARVRSESTGGLLPGASTGGVPPGSCSSTKSRPTARRRETRRRRLVRGRQGRHRQPGSGAQARADEVGRTPELHRGEPPHPPGTGRPARSGCSAASGGGIDLSGRGRPG